MSQTITCIAGSILARLLQRLGSTNELICSSSSGDAVSSPLCFIVVCGESNTMNPGCGFLFLLQYPIKPIKGLHQILHESLFRASVVTCHQFCYRTVFHQILLRHHLPTTILSVLILYLRPLSKTSQIRQSFSVAP